MTTTNRNDAHMRNGPNQTQQETRTEKAAKRAVPELLTELDNLGFARGSIARIVGVTNHTIRKWKHGVAATDENRRRLAELAALTETLENDHNIADPAGWLETPLAGTHLTGIDALTNGNITDIVEYAAGHIDAGELLNRSQPAWKDTPHSQVEVFTAADGQPGIRLKNEQQTRNEPAAGLHAGPNSHDGTAHDEQAGPSARPNGRARITQPGSLLELALNIEDRNSWLLNRTDTDNILDAVLDAAADANTQTLTGASPTGHALCGAAVARTAGKLRLWHGNMPGPVLIVDGVTASGIAAKQKQTQLANLGVSAAIHIVETAPGTTTSNENKNPPGPEPTTATTRVTSRDHASTSNNRTVHNTPAKHRR